MNDIPSESLIEVQDIPALVARLLLPVDLRDLPIIGELAMPRSTAQIASSRIGIGFETLDRFMFDPDHTYPHLAVLGAKWARVQTGWSRCETVKGVYDFAWLDVIVDKLRAIGVQPFFSNTFGNRLYMPDVPHEPAVGCVPLYYGEETREAWLAYVRALAAHFRGRVACWDRPCRQAGGKINRPVMMGLIHGKRYAPKYSFEVLRRVCSLFDDESERRELYARFAEVDPQRPEQSGLLASPVCASFARQGAPLFAYWLSEDPQQKASAKEIDLTVWCRPQDGAPRAARPADRGHPQRLGTRGGLRDRRCRGGPPLPPAAYRLPARAHRRFRAAARAGSGRHGVNGRHGFLHPTLPFPCTPISIHEHKHN